MKRLLLLILLTSSSNYVFSQQVCKGTDCEGLVAGDVLVSIGEIEVSLFCDNEFPIVPSELDGFTCRYNGTPITEPTVIKKNVKANQPKTWPRPWPKTWSAGPSSDKSLPVGWFVQVTSTSTPTRAEEISESLKSLNLNPFINKVQVDDMVRYTIVVGPKIDKKRALVDKELIDKSLGTASMVIPFNLSDM